MAEMGYSSVSTSGVVSIRSADAGTAGVSGHFFMKTEAQVRVPLVQCW